MTKRLLLALLAAVTLAGCHQNSSNAPLAHVDSLLRADRVDSAAAVLRTVRWEQLDEEGRAWHDLLRTQTAYRLFQPIHSDSLVGHCVQYYTAHRDGNEAKLCDALFYKGMVAYTLGQTEAAIVSLKSAERLANTIRDVGLEHKVCTGLMTINYATANYSLALKYARRELDCSQRKGDKTWLAYAYNHLSCVYDKMGQHDSAYFYIERVVPFISDIPKDAQVYHLSNIGLYLLNQGDTVRAQEFLTRAYKVQPLAETSNMLARLYFRQGWRDSALAIWNRALAESDLQSRIMLKETMAEEFYTAGDYRQSSVLTAELKPLKDSLEHQRQTTTVQELQLDYDHQQALGQTESVLLHYLYAVLAVLALLMGAAWLLYRRQAERARQGTTLLREEYNRRLAQLESMGEHKAREADELKRKLADKAAMSVDTLACGRVLYENIRQGGKTVSWTKRDFDDFLSYYKVVNKDFFLRLDAEYDGLSANNRFLLSLEDMGLLPEQVREVLGISSGALRSAHLRIRRKRRQE